MLLVIYIFKRVYFALAPTTFFTRRTHLHTHKYSRLWLPWSGFLFIFFNLNVRASHLTTKRRRHSPPWGIKDLWARLLLVTTSLPACPLFYGSKIVVSFFIFSVYFFYLVSFLFFSLQYYRSSNRNIFNRLENPSYISSVDNIIILSKLVFLEFLSIFLK